MRVWLDDERDPTDKFIQREFNARGDEVWIKTSAEAIKLIETGEVTSISLDHDLCDPDPKATGYAVVLRIEELAAQKSIPKMEWHIHTQNTGAHTKMHQGMTIADKFWALQDPFIKK